MPPPLRLAPIPAMQPERAQALQRLLANYSREDLARMALAEKCKRSLAAFTRAAWTIIEPGTPLRWNWHIDAVCRALEGVSRGQVRKLIINIPPGTMKSILVSVMWPAWVWTWRPGWRGLFSSYALDLAMRDSVRCRSVVESEWYRTTFGPEWALSGDQNVKSFFENTARGFRMAISVGGAGTGFRGDAVVVDDPLKASDAYSDAKRAEALEWWTKTMPTRVNDPATGAFVIVMQRLHEQDLTGHMLHHGGYAHLCLPSEYDPELTCTCGQRPCVTGVLGKMDPRTRAGDLLFPEMFTREVLDELKGPAALGSMGYAGQHQQRPVPADGGMFKPQWWRFWRHSHQPEIAELSARTVVLPDKFDWKGLSWDCAFKGTASSDKVAGGAWGGVGAERYLLDLEWDNMDFPETMRRIKAQAGRHPEAREVLVEEAANGHAVIAMLKGEIRGLIAVKPEGGKESRCAATSPQVEAGQVFLPLHAPWRDRYMDEHTAFPKGAHDDAIDQQSQILLRHGVKAEGARLRGALAAFAK